MTQGLRQNDSQAAALAVWTWGGQMVSRRFFVGVTHEPTQV